MSSKPKNILIVSHLYGTAKGVGGKRWWKFKEELSRQGENVFLLNSEIADSKNQILKYDCSYPDILDQVPTSFLDKIFYRWRLYNQKKKTKGTPYDKAERDLNKIKNQVKNFIGKEKIESVIITGAPFSLFSLSDLKQDYPSVKFILDFRDAGTWGHGYAYQALDATRRDYAQNLEQKALFQADLITFASEDLIESFKNVYNDKGILKKTYVLLNGLESFDLISEKSTNRNSEFLKIAHLGSVNVGTQKYWKHFFHSIQGIENIKVDFYGLQNKELKDYLISNSDKQIHLHASIKEQQIPEVLSTYDAYVFFKRDDFPNSFPTKFFDYIQFRKPLICYSSEGRVTREIVDNKLGFVLSGNESNQQAQSILNQIIEMENFNSNYDFGHYKISEIVANFVKQLNLLDARNT